MDSFRFDCDEWLGFGLQRDMNINQIHAYLGLLCMCNYYGGGHSGFIAGNSGKPKLAIDIREAATLLGSEASVIKETIDIAVKTGRFVVEPSGVIRIVKWDILVPIPCPNGYSSAFKPSLKDRIRQRDNYECQRCGIDEKTFQKPSKTPRKFSVHHIDYNKLNTDEQNLITLCAMCNGAVGANRNYWQRTFSQKVAAMYKDCVHNKISGYFENTGLTVTRNGD